MIKALSSSLRFNRCSIRSSLSSSKAMRASLRYFSTSTQEPIQRDQMDYDVLIVGGGPAGNIIPLIITSY